jgi:hypothetical protein
LDFTITNFYLELGKELGKAKVYFALLQLFALKPSTDVDPVRVYLCKLSSKERRAGALRSEKDLRKRQEMVLFCSGFFSFPHNLALGPSRWILQCNYNQFGKERETH